MAYKCGLYDVIEKLRLSSKVYSYLIFCPEVAETARPGQFIHVRVEGFTLRRPFSVCDIDKKRGTIRIVFEIRGEGTKKLAETHVGDKIDIIAPLGRGFTLPEKPSGKVIVVGGGIGIPPLYGVAKLYGEIVTAILGFRSHDKIILATEFRRTGASMVTCTEDGSVGFKGFVSEPLKEELASGEFSSVYACGPLPMLKSVIHACKAAEVFCEVSLEERMGCGVGACACCTCKILRNGGEHMLRVCKDGPVFNGNEVAL